MEATINNMEGSLRQTKDFDAARPSGSVPEQVVSGAFVLPLTRGFSALVDEEDYERVLAVGLWTANEGSNAWYAVNKSGGQVKYLHRFIMNAPKGVQVDHRNTDTMDCRRSNLRMATQSQNNANRRKQPGCSSQFKGVRLRPGGRWDARIKIDGKQVALGCYADERDAARAYDTAALAKFGDFARVNFSEAA